MIPILALLAIGILLIHRLQGARSARHEQGSPDSPRGASLWRALGDGDAGATSWPHAESDDLHDPFAPFAVNGAFQIQGLGHINPASGMWVPPDSCIDVAGNPDGFNLSEISAFDQDCFGCGVNGDFGGSMGCGHGFDP